MRELRHERGSRGGSQSRRKETVANTPTAETYLPPLGQHPHDEVGRELQATLVELIDLSLIGKQLHWSVSGPLFRSLHLQLDELVESWRDLADTVAERAVTIGFWPDGQARAVAEGSDLTGLDVGRFRTTWSSPSSRTASPRLRSARGPGWTGSAMSTLPRRTS